MKPTENECPKCKAKSATLKTLDGRHQHSCGGGHIWYTMGASGGMADMRVDTLWNIADKVARDGHYEILAVEVRDFVWGIDFREQAERWATDHGFTVEFQRVGRGKKRADILSFTHP